MSQTDLYIAQVERLEADLKRTNPNAFLVLPRVLRRVIKKDLEIASITWRVPHRKCFVASGRRIAPIVARDELGLDAAAAIPDELILLPRPDERDFRERSEGEIRRRLWRLLFHASIDAHLGQLRRSGQLSIARIRSRIDQIGQVAFDEILSVLFREHFVVSPDNIEDAYVEFVAVFAELHFFSPFWLPTYFPSLISIPATLEVISQDIELPSLFERCRLPESLPPEESFEAIENATVAREEQEETPAADYPNPKRYSRLMLKAERSLNRGNSVSAAIQFCRARNLAAGTQLDDADSGRLRAVESLVDRLRDALEFGDDEAETWREAIEQLVEHSVVGFWNPDKKLLYDLQKVCVDHERGIYRVDLIEWLRTLGKRPIKRPLPNQREVLMSKHLRSASRRLVTARLSGDERKRIDSLLHSAAHSAEKQLRRRIGPLVEQALSAVDLLPANVPEEVAWRKLVDELCDGVVQRGYLTIGNFRDSLSRSNIKLADLSGVREFLHGDRLLRADRQLDVALDGVYHRGEFYLRWLQGTSSLAFGTPIGRFVTQYLVIPFGGAFVALEGLRHIAELFMTSESDHARQTALFPTAVIVLGLVIAGLIHVDVFRSLVVNLLVNAWRATKRLLVEFPRWLLEQNAVRRFLRSTPVVALRRFVLGPLIPTLAVCYGVPRLMAGQGASLPMAAVVFLSFNLIFNSRMGRDCEEVAAEWIGQQWYRLRVGVFVALFELTMEFFKWLLESFERLLYAVDEWLRFKSGETSVSLAIKAGLGVIWTVFAYMTRFCVTLLIEPQINPIKHFPVVTVSHKIILPLQPMFARLLSGPLDQVMAEMAAGAIVFTLPGVFGFLVWELNSNWRLYSANRAPNLRPVLVGEHGETMIRLMKPGFHSGTLPKLFTKLRRAERKAIRGGHTTAKSKFENKLHHLEIAVRHFVERELVRMLQQSPAWQDARFSVGRVELASNSIRINLYEKNSGAAPMILGFQEQSGWLVASILSPGWLDRTDGFRRSDLIAVLAGFYKISGVDLVREQVAACFYPRIPPYDIAESGLVMWPDGDYRTVVFYNLHRRSTIRPTPNAAAREFGLPTLESDRMIFGHAVITWNHWVSIWKARSKNPDAHVPFAFPVRLLPQITQADNPEVGTQPTWL